MEEPYAEGISEEWPGTTASNCIQQRNDNNSNDYNTELNTASKGTPGDSFSHNITTTNNNINRDTNHNTSKDNNIETSHNNQLRVYNNDDNDAASSATDQVLPQTFDSISNSDEATSNMTQDPDQHSPVTVLVVNPNSDNSSLDHSNTRICHGTDHRHDSISHSPEEIRAGNRDGGLCSEAHNLVLGQDSVTNEADVVSSNCGESGESAGFNDTGVPVNNDSKDLVLPNHTEDLNEAPKGSANFTDSVNPSQHNEPLNNVESCGTCDIYELGTDKEYDDDDNQRLDKNSLREAGNLPNNKETESERTPSIASIDSEQINAYVTEITNRALTSYREQIVQQPSFQEGSGQDDKVDINSKELKEVDEQNDKDDKEDNLSHNEETTKVDDNHSQVDEKNYNNDRPPEIKVEENAPCVDNIKTGDCDINEEVTSKEENNVEINVQCVNQDIVYTSEQHSSGIPDQHKQNQDQVEQQTSNENLRDCEIKYFESPPPTNHHQDTGIQNSYTEDSIDSLPSTPLSNSPPPLTSSPVMMNNDISRPRTRPKSSHPRRRGQQDTDHLIDDQSNGYESDQNSFIRSPSPSIRPRSPHDIRSPSPNARSPSPIKRTPSPTKRSSSPTKRSTSPTKRSTSPIKRSASPTKRAQSPSIRSPSPGDVSLNLYEQDYTKSNGDSQSDIKEPIILIENAIPEESDRAITSPSPDKGVNDASKDDTVPPSSGSLPGDSDGRLSATKSPCNDRLGRIADAADNIAGMQDNLQDMFREAKGILTHYQSQLNTQSITEFSQDVPEFTQAFSSLSDAYRVCENVTGNIDQQLHDIRTATSEICELITQKATCEDLADLMQIRGSNGRDIDSLENEASYKEQQARLQELKAITAKAAVQAQSAYELAAQAEVKATEADVAAISARKEVEIAIKRIEDANIAAELKKKKDEEEARRIAQENAIKKREEEKRRKEEDERRIAREAENRGTSKEEERRRYLEEKKKLEAERKNPNNWPRYIYSIDGGDWNPGVGLILRSQQGCLERDELEITLLDQMESCLPLGENEELISNIMCLKPVDPNKSYKFEEPMSISIPHCSPRIPPGREPVVKLMTSEGKMSTLSSHDLIFDDIKELKFTEVRTRQFGTMAVFLRSKKEQLTLNKMGGKVISGVDSRVTITSCENAFRTHATFTMEVQPIDQNLVLELRSKKPDPCAALMATSPIVGVHMPTKFHKPLTVTLPCPPNPALRPRRPQTATTRLAPSPPSTEKQDPKDRPLSARMFPAKEETETDEVHLLRKDGTGSWLKMDDVTLNHTKKKDIVSFDLVNPFNKLVLIRTKAGLTNSQVEKVLGHVIVALTFKPVSVIMRQKSRDPNMVTVTCAQSINVERVIKSLADEGFDHGPKPSPDILLTEGQRLALRFRGNLILDDDDEFSRADFKFCNHIPFRLNFTVTEHDKYAQKGFESYRGFSQIFTKGKVRRPSTAVDDRDWATGQRVKDELVDGDILVCEHLIIIPKPEPETPRPLNITPVTLTAEGVVNDEMLRFLSTHLQNNDWKRLAAQLNVRRSRIQAILRQNINTSTTQTVYDILVTWSKRLPRAVNRTDILCKNLSSIGRDDLAEELRIRDEEYRQARHVKARESYLKKAFVAIARNPLAVAQWKHLARYLEVDENEIQQIESTHNSCQESCLASLIRWKESRGEEATIPLLANKLRRCRYRRLAREIEDIR